MPRIDPLTPETATGFARELLEQCAVGVDGQPLTVFAVAAHHPNLLQWWMPLGGELLARGVLPARDRELLMLRIAHLCCSPYILTMHIPMAEDAGLTMNEITRAEDGSAAPGWAGSDAVLLRAVEELHTTSRISAGTWDALAERYDERALLEIIFVVGFYTMLAFYLNSAAIEPETVATALNEAIDRLGRPTRQHRPVGS